MGATQPRPARRGDCDDESVFVTTHNPLFSATSSSSAAAAAASARTLRRRRQHSWTDDDDDDDEMGAEETTPPPPPPLGLTPLLLLGNETPVSGGSEMSELLDCAWTRSAAAGGGTDAWLLRPVRLVSVLGREESSHVLLQVPPPDASRAARLQSAVSIPVSAGYMGLPEVPATALPVWWRRRRASRSTVPSPRCPPLPEMPLSGWIIDVFETTLTSQCHCVPAARVQLANVMHEQRLLASECFLLERGVLAMQSNIRLRDWEIDSELRRRLARQREVEEQRERLAAEANTLTGQVQRLLYEQDDLRAQAYVLQTQREEAARLLMESSVQYQRAESTSSMASSVSAFDDRSAASVRDTADVTPVYMEGTETALAYPLKYMHFGTPPPPPPPPPLSSPTGGARSSAFSPRSPTDRAVLPISPRTSPLSPGRAHLSSPFAGPSVVPLPSLPSAVSNPGIRPPDLPAPPPEVPNLAEAFRRVGLTTASVGVARA